jgi:hypothetical protein
MGASALPEPPNPAVSITLGPTATSGSRLLLMYQPRPPGAALGGTWQLKLCDFGCARVLLSAIGSVVVGSNPRVHIDMARGAYKYDRQVWRRLEEQNEHCMWLVRSAFKAAYGLQMPATTLAWS